MGNHDSSEINYVTGNFPKMETKRFVLRQFTEDDLDNVFKGLSNPLVIRYYGISFSSKEATREQMEWFANLEKNKTGIWWAILAKDTDEFVGAGGLYEIAKSNIKAEIGFWLLPEFWRKGIMREVMPVICDYGFDQLNLHRIEGFVETGNQNCKNGLEKLNFNYEGTMVDCEIKNDQFISLDIYSLFNSKE